MSTEIKQRLAQYPEINFINDLTLDQLTQSMISDFEAKYNELSGTEITLSKADPIRLILLSAALQIYQGFQWVDNAGKMGFLKYSYGDYLDNLGALKGVVRNGEAPAVCTVRFSLSAVRASVVGIPVGTRLTTQEANIYFETDDYAEIAIGSEYVDVLCTAQTAGVSGNGFAAGEICVLVDPIPYIASVANLAETSGGTDKESDDSLAERIYLAPSSYSVAGPEAAYEYFTRQAYPAVGDVSITSPDECEVDICVIGADGSLLSEAVRQSIKDYIDQKDVKPMTDSVTVSSPTEVSYNINFTYYIDSSNAALVTSIQSKVTDAVAEYVKWQSAKIGRDIEPDKLIELVMAAGAKYLTVTSPASRTAVSGTSIAKVGTQTVTYGGLSA